jgi:tRNA-(ms[2]io[6]A)-hydroxylase
MIAVEISAVTNFLQGRTSPAWVDAAVRDIPTLLRDHAALELKAAQQAQALIWRYGFNSAAADSSDASRLELTRKLAQLAREELRHFEQVSRLLQARSIAHATVTPSRYARELHAGVRGEEPGRRADTLIVCAVIEARSCERFASLVPMLDRVDPDLAAFYAALLASETRHFRDYLALAESTGGGNEPSAARIGYFLDLDARLIAAPDDELRFHSGIPGAH